MNARASQRRYARGFSLIELLIVITIMGVVLGMTIPKLSLSSYRVDSIAQQVRSVFQTSQRTSLTRQFDVIISIDTVRSELRIAEDADNSHTIEAKEVKFWRPTGTSEGNIFSVPPRGLTTSTVTTSIVGSSLTSVDGFPSIIFHRDGSASSDAEIYVSNSSQRRPEYRAISLTRSTGRTEYYRLSGTGLTAVWKLAN